MKQIRADFVAQVTAWDRVHRIIGKTGAAQLFDESVEAVLTLPEAETLIDIGAGSGLIGIAWLAQNAATKAVFVEPDAKKTAFIASYLSSQAQCRGRYRVLTLRIEDVSRETLAPFAAQNIIAAARAFSGNSSLEDAYARSGLAGIPLFSFEASENVKKFVQVS